MPSQPKLTHTADIFVEVGDPIALGRTDEGLRRIVPILGGTIEGDGWSGEVLAAGADYQVIGDDGHTVLDARYAARLTTGESIFIVNKGIRYGSPEAMKRLNQGLPVDPDEIYFRTVPRFETDAPALSHLMQRLFIASCARHPNRVEISVFEVG